MADRESALAAAPVMAAVRKAVGAPGFQPVICPGCDRELPPDAFPAQRRSGYCRECVRALARENERMKAAERAEAERRIDVPAPDVVRTPHEPPFDAHEIFLAMADEAEDLTALGVGLRKAGVMFASGKTP